MRIRSITYHIKIKNNTKKPDLRLTILSFTKIKMHLILIRIIKLTP